MLLLLPPPPPLPPLLLLLDFARAAAVYTLASLAIVRALFVFARLLRCGTRQLTLTPMQT